MKSNNLDKNEWESIRNPMVKYDPDMDKYTGVVMFPKKLARAKEMLKKVGLPDFIEKKPLKKP